MRGEDLEEPVPIAITGTVRPSLLGRKGEELLRCGGKPRRRRCSLVLEVPSSSSTATRRTIAGRPRHAAGSR